MMILLMASSYTDSKLVKADLIQALRESLDATPNSTPQPQ
jgi:hypothetical protein